jgi:hypothetical protein
MIVYGATLMGIEHKILLLSGDIVVIFCVLNVDEMHKHLVGVRLHIVFDVNDLLLEY